MSEPISIFEVIKRGGFEASLITTFNATLPFYEEVVLRKLVSAGCRHNVVLMDRAQCAVSWASEATRPRLAGYGYTLLPVSAPGAFHPKLCILVGPKKASVLIGSHNLTISGFGYNREITNWIEVSGSKDAEGASLLADAWQMAKSWIEMERNKSDDRLLEAAFALERFISPLVVNAAPPLSTFALSQGPSVEALIEQLAPKVPQNVSRIGVVGAFFDNEFAFVADLAKRWPQASLTVGIDPDSVQLLRLPNQQVARYVDARKLWPDSHGYLHAKAIYFQGDGEEGAFVSGSANPSRPAWLAEGSSINVEAVLLRTGRVAREIGESTGLAGLFALEELALAEFESIVERSSREVSSNESSHLTLLSSVLDTGSGEIRIIRRSPVTSVDRIELFGSSMQKIGEVVSPKQDANIISFVPAPEAGRIVSCVLYFQDEMVARAMVHDIAQISASAHSTRQYQIRNALSGLGSSEGDISKVIASVERVIFSDETYREVDITLKTHHGKHRQTPSTQGPDSLAINVADLPKEKKKLRLLKSGDLAYLLDVLLRRISEGLDNGSLATDASGRNEEEQVGKEGDEATKPSEPALPPTNMTDSDVAGAVARRARALTRKMVDQLKLAAETSERSPTAVMQLIAVIALVRELRHLDKTPRWKKSGHLLVEERDRRYLLDESVRYLLGAGHHMLDDVEKMSEAETEEGAQLRVLLLWLAWDLGDELTDQIGRIWDPQELQSKLRRNAVLLKLIPPVSQDSPAWQELIDSIARTVPSNPDSALAAKKWVDRHLIFGALWSGEFQLTPELRVGGFCCIPGNFAEPRVVMELTGEEVAFWDYDRLRRFERKRVSGVLPAIVAAVGR